MKATTLRTIVGVATPLILTGSAKAGFVGISTESKPNEFGILAVNVYAEFDRPGEDRLLAITGTASAPMTIEVIGGTFYNHAFGTDRSPTTPLVAAFPSLAFDSFVSIGVKILHNSSQPYDFMMIMTDFPGVVGTQLATTNSGWEVSALAPQGDPFNASFDAGDGSVLIGQFSTLDGSAIQGSMLLQHISNGVSGETVVSFFHVPGPGAMWLLGAGLLARRRRTQATQTRSRVSAVTPVRPYRGRGRRRS